MKKPVDTGKKLKAEGKPLDTGKKLKAEGKASQADGAGRSAATESDNPDGNQDTHIDLDEAIDQKLSALAENLPALIKSHAPDRFAGNVKFEKFLQSAIVDRHQIPMLVMSCDIRKSTILMRESLEQTHFACQISDFIDRARSSVLETGGWFDKFTGDGFISYWLPESLVQPADDASLGSREIGSVIGDHLNSMIHLYARISLDFALVVLPILRMRSGSIPAGAGVSFGIDAGLCQFVPFADDVSIMGSAVVGAVRMVDQAPPFSIVSNNMSGLPLWGNKDSLAANNVRVQRVPITTKEHPQGQEAYLVYDLDVDKKIADGEYLLSCARDPDAFPLARFMTNT